MAQTTIARVKQDLEQFGEHQVKDALVGRIKKAFKPKTGRADHGDWRLMNLVVEDLTGEIKVTWFDFPFADNRGLVGRQIGIRATPNSKGEPSGATADWNSYDNKQGQRIREAQITVRGEKARVEGADQLPKWHDPPASGNGTQPAAGGNGSAPLERMGERDYLATWRRVFSEMVSIVAEESGGDGEGEHPCEDAMLDAAQRMATSAMIAAGRHEWTPNGSGSSAGRQAQTGGARQEPAKPPPVKPPAPGEPMPWEQGGGGDPSGPPPDFDPAATDDDIPF